MRTFLFLGLLSACTAAVAAPVSSAFTYQGELYDSGELANAALYDFRFTPYPDASNPAALGPTVTVEDVLVSNGIFTARVDFGAGFFVGDEVWLEIEVSPADANTFQTLTPRQEITAAPYTLKPAPGSVTDVELADDAVGATQLNDNAVASAEIVDGSIAAADLAPDVLNGTFWRLGGNTGTAGATLGTVEAGQSLPLVAPAGVTINGSRFNSNTELTIRGNPTPVETNADITLWPRGGEAFFNLAVFPDPSNGISTEANTFLAIHAVDSAPSFSGYLQRLILSWDGSLGLGTAQGVKPQARLHVRRNGIGFDTPADAIEDMELVIEDQDAHLGLYSDSSGAGGSVIGLGELNAGAFANQWGIFRHTTGGGGALNFSYGTNTSAAANPVLFRFGNDGSLDADGSVAVGGSLWVSASVEMGAAANTAHAGSFVFADASTATALSTTAANQFLIRAVGGVAINGTPASSSTELTVRADSATSGAAAELAMLPSGTAKSQRLSTQGTGAALFVWADDPNSADANMVRLLLEHDGSLAINPAVSDDSFQTNSFPFKVGTTGNTSNGNGAHVTATGVWTNGSSRHFKQAFTAIDAGAVLDRLLALPITRWRYRGDERAWHLGPVAEDFSAAFGLGDEVQYIGTVDADGVALAAIQGLAARSQSRAVALERENDELREQLTALAHRVEALERGD